MTKSRKSTVNVPHLGGIDAAYLMPEALDNSKPTLILIHGFMMSSEVYDKHYNSTFLKERVNLIGIDLLGHGETRTKNETFTYWDSAIMGLQVMEALGVKRSFVLGTSQGGWVAARMCLLAPDKIQGIIPIGTSMDCESERMRQISFVDVTNLCNQLLETWYSPDPKPSFELDDAYCDLAVTSDFGQDCLSELRRFWNKKMKADYSGESGRRRAVMATINLRDRDTLLEKLAYILCPVLWLHGTADSVFPPACGKHDIGLFKGSIHADMRLIEGGHHVLSQSNWQEVEEGIVGFIGKYHV